MSERQYGGTCPRCGGQMPPYPGALSRWDNRTYICSGCGELESFLQFENRHAGPEAVERSVHPTLGSKRWHIFGEKP